MTDHRAENELIWQYNARLRELDALMDQAQLAGDDREDYRAAILAIEYAKRDESQDVPPTVDQATLYEYSELVGALDRALREESAL
jgi:hypothetical protein